MKLDNATACITGLLLGNHGKSRSADPAVCLQAISR